MNCAELEDWLLEQGGPSIKLRVYNLKNDLPEIDAKKAVSMLLQCREVNTALGFLDGFKVQARDKKTVEHLIHYYKETCIDHFFSKLMTFGFRAGLPAFEMKFRPVIDFFADLHSSEQDYGYCYSLMLHRFFFMAGYTDETIVESMVQRINAIHKLAEKRIFDIYQDGSGLPRPSKQWINRGIIKDDLNPFSKAAEQPLPTIYDLSALAYFPDACMNPCIQKKTDDIVQYILEPDFQKIPEHYGLLWDKSKQQYYACGWAPVLPLYEDNDRPKHIGATSILNYLHLMSRFKTARNSKWYQSCLKSLEQYRTEKGTYIFPKEYLDGKNSCPGSISNAVVINAKPDEAFLSAANMRLKREERKFLICELISTLNMLEIGI